MAKRKNRRSIFGFWRGIFGSQKNSYVDASEQYAIGEAGASSGGGTSGGKRDPSLTLVKRVGLSLSEDAGGSDFEEPEWDFTEITNAYNTEAYIRQAVDKYIEMMFKADWTFVGKNPNAVEYIRMRFKLMAEATGIPTNQLFIEIAEDLVKYCNVTIAKARAKDVNIFNGLQVQPIGDKLPIAGYFPLNVTTMQMRRDKNGTVKNWQQEVEGQDKPVKFKPDDLVHIYYKREKGRGFGTPWILPALEDVRSLRQIEENVLRLVYRHLHPMWHVRVGGDGEGQGGESNEVEEVQSVIENMDVEGGLVTTERVKVEAIASNNALDAKGYLDYFERRVFSGLGVSELLMGRGGTANRSTGDTLSTEFKDRIKALQKVMATFINDKMINEILLEGGFDSVLNPDDEVRFQFNEIDLDSRIKFENQAVYLYEHNAIAESEMRELIGRDPIEDGDLRAGMHLQVITLATAAANAAAKATDSAETDNKNKPTNQHGTKSSPKKATNSGEHSDSKKLYADVLNEEYNQLRKATNKLVIEYGKAFGSDELKRVHGVFRYTQSRLRIVTEEEYGAEIAEAVDLNINRLIENLHGDVINAIQGFDTAEMASVVESYFDVYDDTLSLIVEKATKLQGNVKEGNT